MVITKSKILQFLSLFFSIAMILISIVTAVLKLYTPKLLKNLDQICMLSSKLALPRLITIKHNMKKCNINYGEVNEISPLIETKNKVENNQNEFKQKNSNNFKVIETQFGASGIKCGNFFVKNSTGKQIDFNSYLAKKPKIKIKNKKDPIVLILHTHTTEGYLDRDDGTVPENFYPRTQDKNRNVVAVGEEIVKSLKNKNINAIHDTTVHDYPSYSGSYSRSAKTVRENIKKYPSIQIVIDIHRDSMGEKETGRIKPTFKTKDGEKCAQIMFVIGCGFDGTFKNWEENLSFALNIQSICEKKFPGLTRALTLKNAKYNQNLKPLKFQGKGSLISVLIEVGSDMSTTNECKKSGEMFAESLKAFIG